MIGAKNGSEDVSIQVENFPNMNMIYVETVVIQYYAISDVSGTPNDDDAIIYDAPDATGAGQAYLIVVVF